MEQWKAIPGTNGDYEVSDHGNVRSHKHHQTITLKPRPTKKNYLRVYINNKDRYIHRLVLAAFIGPPPADKPHAAHNDGDPTNNRLDNLRWATPRDNNHDRHRHGTTPCGTRNGRAKLTEHAVREIRRRCAQGERQTDVATALGIPSRTVNGIVRRRAWRTVA